ncbi:MAG: 4Fe-4S binding protein [Deltaproteobacteria bacterium]|nr:4Fe-4S binding protein [Deltaproteobacteria bacterium]
MADIELCRQLAEGVGEGGSQLIQQIFQVLIDDDEAKAMLAASPPATAAEIAQKTGLPQTKIDAMMESLFLRGLIFKLKKYEPMKFYCVRTVPQMHDSTVLTPGISREALDLWKAYMKKEWPEHGGKIMSVVPNSVMRVVPVNETIEPEAQILPYEDVAKIIEGATTLSVTKCSCRVIDGACGMPLEVCMQVDRAAEYNIERGTGREISKKEAADILKMCEEEGLVHCVDNRQVVGHVICNCCKDCCLNWSVMKGPKKWVSPSRYQAVVDRDMCSGCESCIDRCFFDALSMKDDIAAVDAEKCLGCGVCAVVCPAEALSLKEIRTADFVPAS